MLSTANCSPATARVDSNLLRDRTRWCRNPACQDIPVRRFVCPNSCRESQSCRYIQGKRCRTRLHACMSQKKSRSSLGKAISDTAPRVNQCLCTPRSPRFQGLIPPQASSDIFPEQGISTPADKEPTTSGKTLLLMAMF